MVYRYKDLIFGINVLVSLYAFLICLLMPFFHRSGYVEETLFPCFLSLLAQSLVAFIGLKTKDEIIADFCALFSILILIVEFLILIMK
jgi:hypothetical protein